MTNPVEPTGELAAGTVVSIGPDRDGSDYAHNTGWTVVGPSRHLYLVVVREPDHGTTIHVDRSRIIVEATPERLAKGTPVTIRWHNDAGQFHTTSGVVAGYEGHAGARPALCVDDGHRHWIPLDVISTLTVIGQTELPGGGL